MPQRAAGRRLTTVLFLDIVGSTAIASRIGDRRWSDLLSRFQAVVRAELKRFAGHEDDTTGDGFLATFDNPARAVEAAAAIADSVHRLGLEVRSGVHTGEVEIVDRKLAGLAVHLAARVMALAGPAEVLVTATVHDLAIGSGMEVRDAGTHELKGVPGAWRLFAVTGLHGTPLPPALPEADAAARIAQIEPLPLLRRRPWIPLAAAAAVIAGMLAFFIRPHPPVTLLRIDPKTDAIVRTLHDGYYSHHLPASLFSSDGSLWQYIPGRVVSRDSRTGTPRITISVSKDIEAGAPGFGSVWIASRSGARGSAIVRYDEAIGRVQGRLAVPGLNLVSMSAGNGAMWALSHDGTLVRIDPLSNRVSQAFRTQTRAPGVVVALQGYVWICDCEAGHLVQFDPRTGQRRQFDLPERGFLVDADSQRNHSVWMLDPNGNTLTPIAPTTGQAGQPLGFGGHLDEAVIGFGALWVAATDAVYRIDLSTHEHRRIDIPSNVTAGSIAVDQRSGSVWVGNCGCPRNG